MVSFGAGGVAAAVVMLMALAPAGLGSAPVVYHPAYKGVTGKFSYTSLNGCASTKGAASMSLLTGIGKAMSTSTAKTCAGNLGGVNAYSYGSSEFGTQSAIKVVVPVTGTDNLTESWTFAWSSSASWAVTGSCPIHNFAYGYSYVSSSYAYWDNYTGYSGYCNTGISAFGEIFAYLVDTTSGQYYYPVYPTPQPLTFDNYAYNYTSTGFTWYHDTSWSSSGGYSFYNGSYSNNYSFQYSYMGGTFCSGNTCPTSWSNSSTGGASWINGTGFLHSDHYAFVFEILASSNANVQGWAHAVATANFGFSSAGAKLNSVTIV